MYIDLRSIGSNTSIYSDTSRTLSDRAATLIVDVLNALYQELYTIALSAIDTAPHPDQLTLRVDDFGAAISTIRVVGTRTGGGDNVLRRQRTRAGGKCVFGQSPICVSSSLN